MREISLTSLFELFDASVHEAMLNIIQTKQPDYLAVFENVNYDSSLCGDRSVMGIGANFTYKTLSEVDGKHLGDLPSQRKYATCYAMVTDEYAAQAKAAANWGKPEVQPVFERKNISRKPKTPPVVKQEDLTKRQILQAHYQGIERLHDIQPCLVTIELTQYAAIAYRSDHNRAIVCIGAKPMHTEKKVVYELKDEEHEWFIAGYYESDQPNDYHPVGKTFFLHPWTQDDYLDSCEPKVRPKIKVTVEYR